MGALALVASGLVGAASADPVAARPARPVQEPAPSVSVDPASDLVDAQQVAVAGIGFPVAESVMVSQCASDATAFDRCQSDSSSWWSEDGSLTFDFRVEAVIHLGGEGTDPGTEVDCRQPEACVLAFGVWPEEGESIVELARVALHFAPDGPLAPPPTLAVTPSEGLVDGQLVDVSGTGFIRRPWADLLQCPTDPTSWGDCGAPSFAEVEPDGSLAASYELQTVLPTSSGPVDCRIAGQCVLLATTSFGNPRQTVQAPLHFDPDGPLLPPPTLTVTPGDELVDGQTVRVEGAGFRRTQSGAELLQCAGDDEPSWERCRGIGPDWVEIGEGGTFVADAAVLARVPIRDQEGRPVDVVDCRTSAAPCLLVARQEGDWDGAVTAELHFDPDGPLEPDPTITVTPAVDHGDFTDVTVAGELFTADGQVRVELCHAEDTTRCDRENGETPTAAADRTLSTVISGWSTFSPPGDDPVDCRQPPGCVVVARDEERGVAATAPLAFGPAEGNRGRYLDPVFETVAVQRGILYRETVDYRGNPVQLRLDVYQPVGDTVTNRPAVVLMFGGFFKFGDRNQLAAGAIDAAKRGYVTVTIDYRLRPDMDTNDAAALYAAALDAYDDATAAVQWLQAHAADYGIDPDIVIANGYSAGAVLALALAYLPGQRGPETSLVAGAVAMAGLNTAIPDPGEPPTIAFHGSADTILPIGGIQGLCPSVEAVGIEGCELVVYDGADHLFGLYRFRDLARRTNDWLAEVVLEPRGFFDVAADAGGPSTVEEGGAVTLDAAGSTGSGLTYQWAPADRLDDPTAARPVYSGAVAGTETLTLTVTNDRGVSAQATTTVTTVACTVAGTEGDDRLEGSRGHDVLCGRGGDDVLMGRQGNDLLFGGLGDDRAYGGRGFDRCQAETRRSCTRL